MDAGPEPGAEDAARARTLYEAAVRLWIYEGEQVWDRNRVMLTASAILIAALSLVLTQGEQHPRALSTVLGAGGLSLCVAWELMVVYGFARKDAYERAALALEVAYLTLTGRPGPVQQGAAVHERFAMWHEPPAADERGRPIRAPVGLQSRVVALFIPLVFMAIYGVALAEAWR